MWGKRIDDTCVFEALLLDKEELLDGRKSSSKSFLACVDECVSERHFRKGLDIKTKLHMYKRFVKQSELKRYILTWLL